MFDMRRRAVPHALGGAAAAFPLARCVRAWEAGTLAARDHPRFFCPKTWRDFGWNGKLVRGDRG